jgi:uncharacterized integral membrane protein
MPWKLFFYLVLLGLILTFVGLNLGNTTDISFGFVSFEEVPVFMSLFIAFFIGVVFTLPVAIRSSSRKTQARSDRRQLRAEQRAAKKQARLDKKDRKGTETANVDRISD